MVIKYLALASMVALSGAVSAGDFDYESYSGTDGRTYSTLLSVCGSSSDVGYSSLFGSQSEYQNTYPILGQLHSELQAMPGITSDALSYATTRMSTAKSLKNNVFGYTFDIESMISNNDAYISSTEALYESTMEKYQESMDQLQTESNDITSMAIDDVMDDMTIDDDAEAYETDNHAIWSGCLGWWVAGMPYYQTYQEIENKVPRMNGWKDGTLTNDVYEYPSTIIGNLDLSDSLYTYDRSEYYNNVTDDVELVDLEDDEEADEWWNESDTDSSSDTSEASDSDEWWN